LRDQVAYLREQLDQECEVRVEERRRHDTIILHMTERIPELLPPASPDSARLRQCRETAPRRPPRSRKRQNHARPAEALSPIRSVARGGVGSSGSETGMARDFCTPSEAAHILGVPLRRILERSAAGEIEADLDLRTGRWKIAKNP
jgi:hypothetical protein